MKTLRGRWTWSLSVTAVLILALSTGAVANLLTNGDMETQCPNYWTEHQMGGTLSWASDEAQLGLRSLKIVKTGTGTAASWMSTNQAQKYWNHMEGVLYTIGGWAKTSGVNTSPANDNEAIGFYWRFLDGSGNPLVNDIFIPVDQSSATVDWTEYVDEVLLPSAPAEVTCEAIMGSGATGTVWFDHFILGSDPWTAGFFGDNVEEPLGWMAWASEGDVGYARSDYYDDAYSGNYVAKLVEEDDLGDEMVFYSEPVPANASSHYLVSVMVKYEDMNTNEYYYPTDAIGTNIPERANLCFFFHSGSVTEGWNLTGGDQFLYFDQTTEASDGWVMLWTIVESPEDATGFSMRARFNSANVGTAYFDNFSVVEVTMEDNQVVNGDQETAAPFWWYEEDDGGDLIWADDEAYMGNRSLKIAKTGTGTRASWISGNQAQTYWNHMEGVLYTLTCYAMTEGVNTSPSGDDERIGFEWSFLDDSGSDIVNPIFVPFNQDAASSEWTEYADEVLLPSAPAEAYCRAIMGANATGTVWFDNFNIGSDPWTAGFFGADLETPEGWLWWASTGDVGIAEWANVGEEAYSGDYVARLFEEDDLMDEMVYYSVPSAVDANRWYLFDVMIKTTGLSPLNENLFESSVMTSRIDNRAGLCFFFHRGDIEHIWELSGGDQFLYTQQIEADEDWMRYRAVSFSPDDATGASMRARFNPAVQGEQLYDDFAIHALTYPSMDADDSPFAVGQSSAMPNGIQLDQNFPNPFNSTTHIGYTLTEPGQVTLEVYDILGRRVATLVNNIQDAGYHTAVFNADVLEGLGSGMYFYRLNTSSGAVVRKMTFMK